MTRRETLQAEDDAIVPTEPKSVYTAAHATGSLHKAAVLVLVLTATGMPVVWFAGGWQSALLLLVGAAISASGLWEWNRLMAALMARMDAQDAMQAQTGAEKAKAPSVAFAVAGFVVRLLVVFVVLYASLKYLHGSVLALAAGLAMGVFALTVEGVRLLRDGTI